MKNNSYLICLFLTISAIRVVGGDFIYPGQQFGNSSNCVADSFGNIGTCRRISECRGTRNFNELNLCRNRNSRQLDPIVCCPPGSSSPPQGTDTIGEQIEGNRQNENNQRQAVSLRKCLETYPPPPPAKEEENTFHITVVGGELTKPGEFPFMENNFTIFYQIPTRIRLNRLMED